MVIFFIEQQDQAFFSLAMAEMAGKKGRVIAVDVQKKMLDILERRAIKTGLRSRIRLHQCEKDLLGITEKVDFALAFWMAHEVPDPENLFIQIRAILKPEACFLLVEPKFHVTRSSYEKIIKTACEAGLEPDSELKVRMSRAMIFKCAVK